MKVLHSLTAFARIAAAFTAVVKSFVSDILMPILSLLPFLSRNLDEKFAVLKRGSQYDKVAPYNTVKQALDDGGEWLSYEVLPNPGCLS